MEMDVANIGHLNHRNLLKEIDGELVSVDMESIKFLSRSILEDAYLEKVKRGLDLFVQLENRRLLTEKNTAYLAEILYRIGRYDLVSKLNYRTEEMERIFKDFHTKLDPFRVLLHKIADEITTTEVDIMKYDAREYISRIKCDEIKNGFQLFVALEKRNVLTSENLNLLKQMLLTIKRHDLLKLVDRYQDHMAGLRRSEPLPAQVTSLPSSEFRYPPICPAATINPGIDPSYVDPSLRQDWDTTQESFQRTPVGESENSGPHYDLNSIPATVDEIVTRPYSDYESIQMDRYDMTSTSKGYCIIINNENFRGHRNLKVRKGTDMDRGNLKYIWSKLGFYVVIYDNKTSDEMLQIMNHFAVNVNHERHNAFICCILSHGKQGTVYGSDEIEVRISELMKDFKAMSCPSLKEKPKLFFIQACQGDFTQRGVPTRDVVDADGPEDQLQEIEWPRTIPNEADFLLGYATVPGFVSYRSHEHGSWYITCLTMMLDRLVPKHDLLSILTKVNQEVSNQYKVDADRMTVLKQVPSPQFTLTKALFFNLPRESGAT